MIDIKELIEDKSKLNEDTLPQLKEMVERYPFFQTARILYLANLYKQHSSDFGRELHKASVFVPDRSALFSLTEGINYELPVNRSQGVEIETESDENRTISLIDSFLSSSKQNPEDNNAESRSMPSIADLTTDYASFLIQQDGDEENSESDNKDESASSPQLKGAELIDNFIKETSGKQRFEIANIDVDDFVSPQISLQDEEIYTESMVNIYIKQGRYQQALEILRKICLINPQKSANFAAQIKLLEVIISER